MNDSQSPSTGSIISINLKRSDSFLSPDYSMSTLSINVKISNQICSIFDTIGPTKRHTKIVFNGQILCPVLSFDFYNIQNNDTISLISSGLPISLSTIDRQNNEKNKNPFLVAVPLPLSISHKRTLFITKSSNYFKKILKTSNEKIDLEN